MARRKPRTAQQTKAEIFEYDDDATTRSSRGLGWLLFRAPGAAILWWQYYFPSRGNVLLSARQRGHVAMEVFASVAFWLGLAVLGLLSVIT